MKPRRTYGWIVLVLWASLILTGSAAGDFMYKNYLVKYDHGRDLLCEPYVVQKNDWIIKVFERKGEIAYRDFTEFLETFRRVNPHIRDVNLIRPGQHILIPLRRIDVESLPGQATGTVTIPFVTLANPHSVNGYDAHTYIVKRGDTVSFLLSQTFGAYGTSAYGRGLAAFKRLNPDITDINRIYAGQKLKLPVASSDALPSRTAASEAVDRFGWHSGLPARKSRAEVPMDSPLMQVAVALEARLLNHGTYFFPRKSGKDATLDLSRSPVIVLADGTRLMFNRKGTPQRIDTELLKTYWKPLHVLEVPSRASVEELLSTIMKTLNQKEGGEVVRFQDHGVDVSVAGQWIIGKPFVSGDNDRRICITLLRSSDESTSPFIVRFLDQHDIGVREIVRGSRETSREAGHSLGEKSRPLGEPVAIETTDHRRFVSRLVAALGYTYAEKVNITFPYAGIQVRAMSNLISAEDGTPVFVDFGELYGDAVDAIRKTGFHVVQIHPKDDIPSTVSKLAGAVGLKVIHPLPLFAADRPVSFNTRLTFPGTLIETPRKERFYLSRHPLPSELIHFLGERNIGVIVVASDPVS